jgi:hypothetical protein
VTIKSLLFVPNSQPTVQFNESGRAAEDIKLHIRRVFITDDFKDMMPSYHSCVKGIVDSDDLPLNASKETLLQQKDKVLETSIADIGAQCFIIGNNHHRGLGFDMSSHLQSEITLNCADSTAADNLGVFFANIIGEQHETEEVVGTKTMVYVIERDIILVTWVILETLDCILETFPQVGLFLTDDDDDAITGRAFAIKPYPIGHMSDGTKAPNMLEATARTVDKPQPLEPGTTRKTLTRNRLRSQTNSGYLH